ncbi:ExeM/NucH family extracellular endonuclease [Aeromicrobium sp. Leaf350]|uniref:ExeM/NucH family extracellular endonuclease n=1 Tax=Aeromicrobium sp. Leaf350 TaxID=2876565 RepID=UPI00351D644E
MQGGSNAGNGVPLPTADLVIGGFNPAATGGIVALVDGTTALPATTRGDVVVAGTGPADLVGYGNASTFETLAAPAPTATNDPRSIVRTDAVDSDDNSADLTLTSEVTPCTAAGCDAEEPEEPEEPVDPTDATIAEVQGDGAVSPLVGSTVRTQGVVTAAYPTGGLDGVYLQTSGTGGPHDPAAAASHGIFVYSKALATEVAVGQLVEVTGVVSEYFGLTQITPAASAWQVLEGPAEVQPTAVDFPIDETQREALEGMLVSLEGDWTVTDNYTAHSFGEIGLAAGTEPLEQPTDVVAPGSAEYTALVAENAARSVVLDDGSSANYTAGAKDVAQPWLTADNEVRIGAPAEVAEPLVLDYRFDTWRVQPTSALTADGAKPVTFGDTREAAPDDVGGAVKIASFNVLNYFTTTGADFVASGGRCTYYGDRTGEPVNVNSCTPNGPRGAADEEDLQRQQAKIVNAINTLDADVVGLEEIENSAAFGQDRDAALDELVTALNAATGEDTWAAVPSPATAPTTGEDVIRTAFIHRTDVVEPVGESAILDDPAFVNARAPLAQAFRPAGGGEDSTFLVVVNHFKSKGSGSGADADTGDGQGASNYSRVLQATALVQFAADQQTAAGTDQAFLIGDFNSYTQEDPLKVLADAGYVNVGASLDAGETYAFDGQVGSLDHVFASAGAFERVTGADTWDVNADEAVAREYSRYNQNATLLYDDSVFRASDHDPTIVGYDPVGSTSPEVPPTQPDFLAFLWWIFLTFLSLFWPGIL